MVDKGFNYVDYYASKSAVLQMGRSMACELGPKRIRVNTISPGYVYTTYVSFPDFEPVWAHKNR